MALLDFLTMRDASGASDEFIRTYEETWLEEMGTMQDRSLFLAVAYAITAQDLEGRAMAEETATLWRRAKAFRQEWAD